MTRRWNPLRATELMVSRWTRFLFDIQDLTLEGTMEPRRWIGCAEQFWIGMAEDAGDWLELLTGEGASSPLGSRRPAPTVVYLPVGYRVAEVTVEVPREAFARLDAAELSLRPSLFQCGDDVILTHGRNLIVTPPAVSRAQRVAKLRLFDLPTLRSGMELRGVVWAETASGALPVAEIRIVVT